MATLVGVMELATAPAQPLELLTPGQLAREIKTTPQTVNGWHRAGIIPAKIDCGRIVRFDRAEVMAALSTRKRDTPAHR